MTDQYSRSDLFDSPQYLARFKRLLPMLHDSLWLDRVPGRRVVDLACGGGWWGMSLEPHGAKVIYVDGRKSCLSRVLRGRPWSDVRLLDLERDDFDQHHRGVDLVLCMGILYHVADPRRLLDKVAIITSRVVVDTTVLDCDDDRIIFTDEAAGVEQYSLSGRACRPSPAWVERNLREAGFRHVVDVSDARGNVPAVPGSGMSGLLYDWECRRTCGWRRDDQTLRKMYVATKEWPDDLLRV